MVPWEDGWPGTQCGWGGGGQLTDGCFLLATVTIVQIIMTTGLRAQTPEATRHSDSDLLFGSFYIY